MYGHDAVNNKIIESCCSFISRDIKSQVRKAYYPSWPCLSLAAMWLHTHVINSLQPYNLNCIMTLVNSTMTLESYMQGCMQEISVMNVQWGQERKVVWCMWGISLMKVQWMRKIDSVMYVRHITYEGPVKMRKR